MKTVVSLLAVATLSITSTIASSEDSDHRISVMERSNTGPVLIDHGPVTTVANQESVLKKPVLQFPAQAVPEIQAPVTNEDLLIVDNFPEPIVSGPQVPSIVCQTCFSARCCCQPKRPRNVTFQLVDPSGCCHEACVKVPACCADEAPRVSWKYRLVGRQVATLCWDCCDHQVKVVVTRRGKVKVRG